MVYPRLPYTVSFDKINFNERTAVMEFAKCDIGSCITIKIIYKIRAIGYAQFIFVERGSSVVEFRTRKRESPGSNPLCYRFVIWAFSFSSRRLSRLSCVNEYLVIDSGGHVSRGRVVRA